MTDETTPRDELEELDDRIDDLKEQAEADDGILTDDEGPEWHESGSIRPDLDDQAIANP